MEQLKIKKTESETGLAEKFKAVKEQKEEQPLTRIVELVYRVSCGCGPAEDYTVKREVPFDSHFRDGHRVDELLDTDFDPQPYRR